MTSLPEFSSYHSCGPSRATPGRNARRAGDLDQREAPPFLIESRAMAFLLVKNVSLTGDWGG